MHTRAGAHPQGLCLADNNATITQSCLPCRVVHHNAHDKLAEMKPNPQHNLRISHANAGTPPHGVLGGAILGCCESQVQCSCSTMGGSSVHLVASDDSDRLRAHIIILQHSSHIYSRYISPVIQQLAVSTQYLHDNDY